MSASQKGITRAILGIAGWLRGQEWIRTPYRLLPLRLRAWIAGLLTERVSMDMSFARSSDWSDHAANTVIVDEFYEAASHHSGAGINIFAYLRGQFGLGESARMYARALLEAGYPLALIDVDIDLPHGLNDHSLDAYIGESAPYDVCLLFINPDYFPQALSAIGKARLDGKYIIACWFWELEKIPHEWLPAIAMVDEIMVSSTYVRDSFRRVTDKPILLVPLPLSDVGDSGLNRTDFGIPEDTYVFLNSFDFNSWIDRKNPRAVVESFLRAFPAGNSGVSLLLKTSNGHRNPGKLRQLLEISEGDPRIIVRDEIIGRAHIQALQRCANAYVSLHRAEGFGLGMAECMALGKPVIATNWSGNVDFMTPDNSCLVDYELIPVNEGEYAHHEGQRWAEASRTDAARFMRRLVEEPAYGVALGAKASREIRATLAPNASARIIIARLEELHHKNRWCAA